MSVNRTKLPDSITNPRLRAIYEAALDELDLISAEMKNALVYLVSDTHKLPIPDVLPLLAKDLNVHGLEYLNAENSDNEAGEDVYTKRREVVENSFRLHKRKGTAGIIRAVSQMTGRNDINVKEWFDFDGHPYTFKVTAQLPLSQYECDVIFGLIKQYKRFVCRELNEYVTQKYGWMPVSGLMVGRYVDFGVTVIGGELAILSPTGSETLYFWDVVTISGTCDLANGTAITISILMPDNSTATLSTTVNNMTFSKSWEIPSNHGSGSFVITARGSYLQDSVTISAVSRTLAISAPATGDEIQIGNTVTISGTTNWPDGSIVTLALFQGGQYAGFIGETLVENGAFSHSWTVAGSADDAVIQAMCGYSVETVGVSIVPALTVDEPETNDVVYPDVSFYAEVSGCSDGDVEVYYGSTLLTTLTASEGTASGNVTIPGRLLGGGYAYIVSGGTETRVGDTANLTVRFVNNGAEAVVNVVATLDGNQDLGPAEGTAKTAPDHTATGEIDYGEAEGSVVSQKADREQSNSINYGTAKVSEVRFDIVDWFLDEGTATGAVKNTTDESDTNNHDMGDAAGTVTITTGE